MNRTKLPIREQIGNVPQFPIGVDVVVAEAVIADSVTELRNEFGRHLAKKCYKMNLSVTKVPKMLPYISIVAGENTAPKISKNFTLASVYANTFSHSQENLYKAEETDIALDSPEKIVFEDSNKESEKKEPEIMGDRLAQADPALMDFSRPKIDDIQSTIIHPNIQDNTFKIKPGTIQMVQNSVSFGGAVTEDPNMHIRNFVEICSTFKYNGFTDEAIKLRLFPFSMRDKAKDWLHSLQAGSITTWEDLAQKFLVKFYQMAKTTAMRSALTQFAQQPGESMCEAWECYKEMLRKCPHHGMPDWMVITGFYNSLGVQSRPMLDVNSGGSLWAKSYTEAYNLIETMAANEYQNPTQRMMPGKVAGILEVDASIAIVAQLTTLTMKVDCLTNYGINQLSSICELCAGSHATDQCSLLMNLFKNHPNFSWSNNQNVVQQSYQQAANKQFNPPGFQQPQQYAQRQSYPQQGGDVPPSSADFKELKLLCKSQVVSIKTLENQIGQIANALLNLQPGTLPSDTEVPGRKEAKEQVKAVTLRFGKVADAKKAKDVEVEVVDEEGMQKEKEGEPRKTTVEHTLPEDNTGEK
ncbi:hypothetical protein AgCh_034265 [Apium graveolens]